MSTSLPENRWIEDRKFRMCPSFEDLSTDQLIVECPRCHRFFAACCHHGLVLSTTYRPKDRTRVCHHPRLAFTDGACANNGAPHASAGIGVCIGTGGGEREGGSGRHAWSLEVDERLDPGKPRTSQRAEVLAALEGLRRLVEADASRGFDEEEEEEERRRRIRRGGRRRGEEDEKEETQRATYIIVTDSEYVVKGITEWFPSWRRRGWRTSSGNPPANLDLFRKLDAYVAALEADNVAVGFWHVPRAYNRLADALAKKATTTRVFVC